MMKYGLLTLLCFFMMLSVANAGELKSYTDNDVVLEGYLALPDAQTYQGQRPTVLIIHQWKGLGAYEKRRADMLADLGYVAFAVDMYGAGVRPSSNEEADAEASKYKNNPELARGRSNAALTFVRTLPQVNPDQIAAIGYCFGGTMALELARSGADIKGVVSFHGGLATKELAKDQAIKASVFVHHGADDPHVSAEEVRTFKAEMDDANVDWHFVSYADAVHAFTEKEAGNDPSKGAAYNEKADKRSWAYTLAFFNDIL